MKKLGLSPLPTGLPPGAKHECNAMRKESYRNAVMDVLNFSADAMSDELFIKVVDEFFPAMKSAGLVCLRHIVKNAESPISERYLRIKENG